MTYRLKASGAVALTVLALAGAAVPAHAQNNPAVTSSVVTTDNGTTSYDKTTRSVVTNPDGSVSYDKTTRQMTSNPDGVTSYDKTTRSVTTDPAVAASNTVTTTDPYTGATITRTTTTQGAPETIVTTRTTEDSWTTPEETTYTTSSGKTFSRATSYGDANNGDDYYVRPTGTYAMGTDRQGNTTQRYENKTTDDYNN